MGETREAIAQKLCLWAEQEGPGSWRKHDLIDAARQIEEDGKEIERLSAPQAPSAPAVTEEMRRVVRKAVYDAQPFEGCHDKDCLTECSPGKFRCQRFADKIATAALTAALPPSSEPTT